MFGIENISWNNFLCVSMPLALAIDGFFSYKCIRKSNKETKDTYITKNDLANEESTQSEYSVVEPENATFDDNFNYDDIPDMISSESEKELFQLADDLTAQSEVVCDNNMSIDFENVTIDVELPSEEPDDDNKEETIPIEPIPEEVLTSTQSNIMELEEYETIGNSYNWN